MKQCPFCAEDVKDRAIKCKHCGSVLTVTNDEGGEEGKEVKDITYGTKNKNVAGVLALFLGGIGVHKFYLGHTGMGIVYLLFVWTWIPSIIGFIEGILFFIMKDEEFNEKFNLGKENVNINSNLNVQNKQEGKGKMKTKICPNCKAEIVFNATTCPHCKAMVGVGSCGAIIIGFFILMIVGMIGTSIGDKDGASKGAGTDTISLCVYSQMRVEEELKSPKSAEHPSCSSGQASKGEGGKYYFSSYVDAHNSFGALIRTNYRCTLWGFEGDSYNIKCEIK